MPENITDHSQCIDKLIASKEKYPYYYWFISIFFFISLTAFLTFNLFRDMPFNETSLMSGTITQQTQHAANYSDFIKSEAFGQKFSPSTSHLGLPRRQ